MGSRSPPLKEQAQIDKGETDKEVERSVRKDNETIWRGERKSKTRGPWALMRSHEFNG